jgi:hypothetical protein
MTTPCPKAFLKSSVVVKWNYVTPVHVAHQIRQMRATCRTGTFLDCLCEFHECSKITSKFAELHHLPGIRDPVDFLRYFEMVSEDVVDAV